MSVCPSCGAKIESSQPECCPVCYTCLIADNEVSELSGINKIVEESSQNTHLATLHAHIKTGIPPRLGGFP